VVTALAKAALSQANIPMHLRSIDQEYLDTLLERSVPTSVISKYATAFRSGLILKAQEHPNSCGKGLWISSGALKGSAEYVVSALVHSLVLEEQAHTVTWVHIDDLIEDGMYNTTIEKFSDLMVVQGIGEHHKSASGFADTMISGLLRRRFNKGLPTFVPTSIPVGSTGLEVHDMFIQVVFQ
jgi:hypothetical protein